MFTQLGAILTGNSILFAPFAFIFGAVIGSFLNVCIHRIPKGLSIVYPPSRCPGCGSAIAFYDNIPIVSYLFLLGRCRNCKNPISAKYPLVEALTGAFAALVFLRFGFTPELFAYFALTSMLIVITFIDLELQIIPNIITIPGIFAGFIASLFLNEPGVTGSVIGILVGGGLLFGIAAAYMLLTGKEGMGGGDIKMLAMIGAFLGWKGVIVTLLAGSFFGALIGGAFMLISGKGRRNPIPFGPFLAAGALIHLFYGLQIIDWYIQKAVG